MYKIALIQPIVTLGKAIRIEKSPTGIQNISSYLKEKHYNVKMFHRKVDSSLFKDLFDFEADIIGISSFTVSYPAAKNIADTIKKNKADTPIILGGWHASGCAISYMEGYERWSLREILNKNSSFDYIVVGEGEIIFKQLIEKIKKYSKEDLLKQLEDMKGIGYILPDNTIVVSRAERIKCIDSLPFPDWNDLDIDIYRDKRDSKNLDLSVHLQRGCRYNCTFCQTPKSFPGNIVRINSMDSVSNYIDYLIKKFSPTIITFTDEDFMSNIEWVTALCQMIIKKEYNKKVRFDSFASITDIDRFEKKNVLTLMKKAGFFSFFAGIESFNKKTLKIYERPLLNKKDINEYINLVQHAVYISKKNGLILMADYMIGFFFETEYEARTGFEQLKLIKGIPYIYLPIFTPFPGTKLWKIALEKDLLLKKDGKIPWELYDCSHQVTKLDYNLTSLREELEQSFYTSKQYKENMVSDIKQNKQILDIIYLPLFRKLCLDYPDNKELKSIFLQLSK